MTFHQIVFISEQWRMCEWNLKIKYFPRAQDIPDLECQSPEDNHANGLLTSSSPVCPHSICICDTSRPICPHSICICDISRPICSPTSTVPLISPHRTETVCLPRLWLVRRGTLGSEHARFWEMFTVIEIKVSSDTKQTAGISWVGSGLPWILGDPHDEGIPFQERNLCRLGVATSTRHRSDACGQVRVIYKTG